MKNIKVIINTGNPEKVSFDIIIDHKVTQYRSSIDQEDLKEFKKLGKSAYVAMIIGREVAKFLSIYYGS